ncbi:NADPH-dependent methylglyoxal reductase GRE2 [Rhizoctonia solani AG-1 IB]|uniref:NADPH-dependent methylglyoxal reductase GRE2 n=1 Tax=Thanatephorus cucumeris (strain AG1-IB / isolate 7/3/14) TaxID=1108050 RepID=M5C5E3_THACB|nr:NADPH-dependent methylglyoxal reductase GRE2 [Rhizoctonia solani AG-1 IB]
MPSVKAPAKILLTGANGYYATHAIKDFLDRGYTVVGTVRSDSKGRELAKVFPEHSERFSYAVVPNIVEPGAFDEVIKKGNFDAVAHAASPVVVPGDFVKPAIDGTVGILHSIKSYGHTVKRVVITSSTVAVYTFQKDIMHNETHWNDYVIKHVEEQGDKADSIMLYIYSKTLAEKAVWKWWSENKQGVTWDLATINPSFMLGAPINAVSSRDQLTSTNAVLSSVLAPHKDLTERAWPVAHVRDIAAVHSALFERTEDVSGRRAIVVASEPSWQDMFLRGPQGGF